MLAHRLQTLFLILECVRGYPLRGREAPGCGRECERCPRIEALNTLAYSSSGPRWCPEGTILLIFLGIWGLMRKRKLNAEVPGLLASLSKRLNFRLVYISTGKGVNSYS